MTDEKQMSTNDNVTEDKIDIMVATTAASVLGASAMLVFFVGSAAAAAAIFVLDVWWPLILWCTHVVAFVWGGVFYSFANKVMGSKSHNGGQDG